MGFDLGKFINDAAKVAGIKVKVSAHLDSQVLGAAANLVKGGEAGFNSAVTAMKNAVNPAQLNKLRDQFNGINLKGFDVALATHIGMANKTAPVDMHPAAQAGFYINHGITGAPDSVKAMAIQQVSSDPNAKAGAVVSAKAIISQRAWWVPVVRVLTLGIWHPKN